MNKLFNYYTIFAALFVAATFSYASNADAGRYGIKCQGQFQVVQGRLISTTPCEEAYIAKVARSYGYNISTKDIRYKAYYKVSVCRALGHDIRLSGICGAYKNRRY